MRTSVDMLVDQVKDIPAVGRRTAVFVAMVGNLARVNVGDSTIDIPCVGFYPPIPGMVVQLENIGGQWKVTDPAVALPAIGVIAATGTPQATVTINGDQYPFYYRAGYTPSIGDQVEVNWATGVIQGKITGANTGTETPTAPPPRPTPLPTAPVLASDSGQYRSRWQSNDVRASDSVSGAWVYAGRVAAALRGATVTRVEIYLPVRVQMGVCTIGTHSYATLPGGWVGTSGPIPLDPRGGWVTLPTAFIPALAAGGGISVTSGNGDNQWAGTQADALSGALRFQGTR